MEALAGLAILGAAGWGIVQAGKSVAQAARRRPFLGNTDAVQRAAAQRQQQYLYLNHASREMQAAILRLETDNDPDYRRAAAAARIARQVPASFRQQQFRRLRPLLVSHFGRCRARGTDGQMLLDSLVELVEALGIADFEADYIRQEAERRLEHRPGQTASGSPGEFQARLQQLQQDHDQRVQVIRSLATLSEDVREQLLEAEDQRFQQQLFGRQSDG